MEVLDALLAMRYPSSAYASSRADYNCAYKCSAQALSDWSNVLETLVTARSAAWPAKELLDCADKNVEYARNTGRRGNGYNQSICTQCPTTWTGVKARIAAFRSSCSFTG